MLVFQDTKSWARICIGRVGVITGKPIGPEERFHVNIPFHGVDHFWYIHPDDIRPLSKLDKVLE